MESAVEALKMAFGVFIFVMALSISISTFSLARETADIVLKSADETAYYEYQEGTTEYRIVGLETIIPTIYKYNKENYTIKFRTASRNADGTLNISDSIEESNGYKLYTSPNTGSEIYELDLNAERLRNEPWTGSNDEIKKHLDALIQGGVYEFNDSTGRNMNYSQGLISKFNGKQFAELVGRVEEITSTGTASNKTTSKTVITYVLLN